MSFVVEPKGVQRSVGGSDVDLAERAPEASGRGGRGHRLAARPEFLAGRAIVRVQHRGAPTFEHENDTVDDDWCRGRREVGSHPPGRDGRQLRGFTES